MYAVHGVTEESAQLKHYTTNDPITIFLIVLGLFCVDLFLLSCFLLREIPLAFFVKLVWWYWILLTFA